VALFALQVPASAAGSNTPSAAVNATPVSTTRRLVGSLIDVQFFSPTLNLSVAYRVYLPPDYASGGQAYPVLYMLHGVGGNYTEWTVNHLPEAADDLTQRGVIQPMLVVMPDARGRTFWAN
jgi:enterochelin esterase-like enzyme